MLRIAFAQVAPRGASRTVAVDRQIAKLDVAAWETITNALSMTLFFCGYCGAMGNLPLRFDRTADF